jgi:VanZ family protein
MLSGAQHDKRKQFEGRAEKKKLLANAIEPPVCPPVDPGRGEGTEPLGSALPIWRRPHFLSYWLPPILWGLAVICMSGDWGSSASTGHLLRWLLSRVALTPAQIDLINFCLRKTGHVLAYALMYFLWFRAFRSNAGCGPWRAGLWSLGFCLLFSSADEGRQRFFASRGASIYDVLLDMSGASLAGLITGVLWTPRPRPPVNPG